MNLAGYIRVSTEGQIDAFGKDVQREAILRWAGLNHHKIVAWFEEDGVSGIADSGDRPALSQSLVQCAGVPGAFPAFGGIVFLDATRLARRLYVQETLLALIWSSGLRVFTTTAGELEQDDDDPTRILIRQILGVIAEFDHRSTVKKLQTARKIKSSQGGYIGGTTRYGTTVQGVGKASQFVPDEAERQTVAKIRRWYRLGYNLRDIAGRLNTEAVPTKTGKGRWHPSQVTRILDRPEI